MARCSWVVLLIGVAFKDALHNVPINRNEVKAQTVAFQGLVYTFTVFMFGSKRFAPGLGESCRLCGMHGSMDC
eukprot:3491767-Amphidinium_carterae.1